MSAQNVLWIDDDIDGDNPAVTLLKSCPLNVDCATTGEQGLNYAISRNYAAIILDLRLPDIPGIAVLGALAAIGVRARTMILTAYPDDYGLAAWRALGAVALHRKPLCGDELTSAVLGCVEAPVQPSILRRSGGARTSVPLPDEDDARARVMCLLDPDVSDGEFAALLDDLRGSCRLSGRAKPNEPVVHEDPSAGSEHVRGILRSMRQMLSSGLRPSEAGVGHRVGLSPSRVSHLLHEETGRGFREWRTVLVIRQVLPEIVAGDEQISQIVYRSAAMEYPNQFAREFRLQFGMAPRQFRNWFRRRQSRALPPLK